MPGEVPDKVTGSPFSPADLDFLKGVEAGRIAGRQIGRKEVVEFLKAHKFLMTKPDYQEWLAQLKVWGIE